MKEWPEELRPRLSDRVRVRLQRSGGDFSDTIVVLYVDDEELAVIDGRAWRLLSCCDGTRDLEGVRRAASARGTRTSVAQLKAFLGQLHAAGCLEDGPLVPPDADPESGSVTSERPGLEALPGFALDCDGRGSCCRFFATMTFRPDEVLRARALLPMVNDAGAHPWQGFSPTSGSVDAPWRASAVATRRGRCSYLDEHGQCAIHRAGGATAKPLGCQVFPALVVDTGRALRVGPRPECACVLRSGRRVQATVPLVEAPLDPGIVVHRLPERLDVGETVWPRAQYLAWAETAEGGLDQPLAWLEREAARLGADLPMQRAELDRRIDRVRVEPDSSLFSSVVHAVGQDEGPSLEDEAFYLRAVAFSHLWALDPMPLAASLARRAAVLRLARRLRPFDDDAARVPLALAEALAKRLGFLGG